MALSSIYTRHFIDSIENFIIRMIFSNFKESGTNQYGMWDKLLYMERVGTKITRKNLTALFSNTFLKRIKTLKNGIHGSNWHIFPWPLQIITPNISCSVLFSCLQAKFKPSFRNTHFNHFFNFKKLLRE